MSSGLSETIGQEVTLRAGVPYLLVTLTCPCCMNERAAYGLSVDRQAAHELARFRLDEHYIEEHPDSEEAEAAMTVRAQA